MNDPIRDALSRLVEMHDAGARTEGVWRYAWDAARTVLVNRCWRCRGLGHLLPDAATPTDPFPEGRTCEICNGTGLDAALASDAGSVGALDVLGQTVLDRLLELDRFATWSALNRPEYPPLREALNAYKAAYDAERQGESS